MIPKEIRRAAKECKKCLKPTDVPWDARTVRIILRGKCPNNGMPLCGIRTNERRPITLATCLC